jgi:predicted nucleic acid-binding protein
MADLRASSVYVPIDPLSVPQIVAADPTDDFILATAAAGRADVVVTLDKHFDDPAVRAFCAAHGIRILDDQALLAELRRHS